MQRMESALCLAIAFVGLFANAIASAKAQQQNIESLLSDAQSAQARGDFSRAADSYRSAVKLQPDIPELWANLGLMDHETGKIDEAMQCFKKAIALKPSLFVPQLFLGIEYLGKQNPSGALAYLERASQLNPNDEQAEIALGEAESALNRGDLAAAAYLRAAQLKPNDGNAWLGLGTAYLQQVENDARAMTSTYANSQWVKLRAAETLAEEGKLVQAEEAFAKLADSPNVPSCGHAEYGITLLREHKNGDARAQFMAEEKMASQCELHKLGTAIADISEGEVARGAIQVQRIAQSEPDFLTSNLPLFRGAVADDRVKEWIEIERSAPPPAGTALDLAATIQDSLLSDVPGVRVNFTTEGREGSLQLKAEARGQLTEDRYRECQWVRSSVAQTDRGQQSARLAACLYEAGDYLTASNIAAKLREQPHWEVIGLYWETRADQKLAVGALMKAGEIDSDSPRMHVLLGDVYRQKRRWSDAEAEYRKAVALDPKSRSAQLSLAIALFTELKLDESLALDQSLLNADANDPEANLLAGEILVQRNQFAEAENYLNKCKGIAAEYAPRLHILLGRVYAETGRVAEAIAEYKRGISSDEDGSVHYQLARLYQKIGEKAAAAEQMQQSKLLREHWDAMASVALQQLSTDSSHQ